MTQQKTADRNVEIKAGLTGGGGSIKLRSDIPINLCIYI